MQNQWNLKLSHKAHIFRPQWSQAVLHQFLPSHTVIQFTQLNWQLVPLARGGGSNTTNTGVRGTQSGCAEKLSCRKRSITFSSKLKITQIYFSSYLWLQLNILRRSTFNTWIPWNLSFRYIHWTGQFTPKMKANAEPRLLSSLVWIDSGLVVSQHRLESYFIK